MGHMPHIYRAMVLYWWHMTLCPISLCFISSRLINHKPQAQNCVFPYNDKIM